MFFLARVLCLSLSGGLVLSATPTYEGNEWVNCGGIYTEDNGTIESPGWPHNYPNRRRCVYEIRAPPGRTIALQFPTFHLQPRLRIPTTRPWRRRCFDWISLFDGANLIGGPFCGEEISPYRVFTSETYKITIFFWSDRRRVFPGFRAIYTYNKCGRPVVPRRPWTRVGVGNKILGGNTAAPGSYPWQVALTDPVGNVMCGGALLNENWVVTAASCVDGLGRVKDVWVVVGEHDISKIELKDLVEVQKVIIYPEASEMPYISNDIALLKLESPLSQNDYVMPICLPDYSPGPDHDPWPPVGTIVTVTGWGTISDQGEVSPVLLQTNMLVVSTQTCSAVYDNKLSEITMMCTGYDTAGVGACRGEDAGGPVVLFPSGGPAYLVGLVSLGPQDCGRQLPSVNTRVSAFLGWIQETMDRNP
ncbi:chymotrypsinogen B-like [Branchiostoma lanceolatum]|uniref:chymotrypsinogen B-like n=1 Tax=Branchiostoma lanceolatum TaxID=7740 RepID=UPI0034546776